MKINKCSVRGNKATTQAVSIGMFRLLTVYNVSLCVKQISKKTNWTWTWTWNFMLKSCLFLVSRLLKMRTLNIYIFIQNGKLNRKNREKNIWNEQILRQTSMRTQRDTKKKKNVYCFVFRYTKFIKKIDWIFWKLTLVGWFSLDFSNSLLKIFNFSKNYSEWVIFSPNSLKFEHNINSQISLFFFCCKLICALQMIIAVWKAYSNK